MYSILLAIIYLAFISLGLPDSLLGAAWPVMHEQLDAPIAYAGILSMIISGGTIVSSLLADRLIRKLGIGLVTAISILMTAMALLGFSTSDSFVKLCLWAVPYGLGAGAVDAALNNYIALHYASRHMSWLHCFWGVGAAFSPYIMGFHLTRGYGWHSGYRFVAIIQFILAAIVIASLPLWNRRNTSAWGIETPIEAPSLAQAFNIKGVKLILLVFLCYCTVESTTGLWASSYLVEFRGIDSLVAATFASFFYLGITFGRFLNGFIADRIKDRYLIRWGMILILSGIVLVGLPIDNHIPALLGLVVTGLGCAPVYPSIIHSTPSSFGEESSQAIIGIQMASAYTGSTFMPLVFGFIADKISIGLYPLFLLSFAILMLLMSEILNKVIAVS
jgi:fucose permease